MKESILIVPEEFLLLMKEKQDKIISLLERSDHSQPSEILTERQAMEVFKRKATWFWQMRKSGMLPYSKIGKSIFYLTSELEKLLHDSTINISKPNKK